jgi:hypothetical protein
VSLSPLKDIGPIGLYVNREIEALEARLAAVVAEVERLFGAFDNTVYVPQGDDFAEGVIHACERLRDKAAGL